MAELYIAEYIEKNPDNFSRKVYRRFHMLDQNSKLNENIQPTKKSNDGFIDGF